VGNPGDGINGGSPRSVAESDQVSSVSGDTTKSSAIRTIASPKMLTKSSPVNELARRNNLQLRVDTAGRNALNKYAQNPPSLAQAAKMTEEHSPTSVEEDKTNMIPIANFKSNKLS